MDDPVPAGPMEDAGPADRPDPQAPEAQGPPTAEGELPAPPDPDARNHQADWGIAAVVRTAQIPFEAANGSVSSFIPMMFYEGRYFFLRGLSAGAHLWTDGDTEVNALARARFVDIPAEVQNEIQGDTVDFGVQLYHEFGDAWWATELLSDEDGRVHVNGRLGTDWHTEDLDVVTSLQLSYLTSRFNSYYYGLSEITNETAGSGWQLSPGITARYHVFSDLYLLGAARYTFNDHGIAGLDTVDQNGQYEVLFGFGFFQNADDSQFLGHGSSWSLGKRGISTPAYVRAAYGEATPSSLNGILSGEAEKDEYENRLSSVFYGVPLTDTLFGAPLDVYLTPGFVWHHSSEVQESTQEYVLGIKAYYTIPWPIRWRLGAAEGLSWIESVTYIEETDLVESGYRPSQLMNYLDFSLDLNMGDLLHADFLKPLWLGYSIHHRSSIFETASQFGRIKGGSNYQTLYLQWDLL